MPHYSVVEGEGVAGPVAVVSAVTTAMSSCMALVFHNTRTDFAGLYHIGAGTLQQPIVQESMLAMINDLQPTRVYITLSRVGVTGTGSTLGEWDAIDQFLLENASAARQIVMPDRSRSSYRLVDGRFVVNDGADGDEGVRPRSVKWATQRPAAHGRSVARNIHANIMFYGGTRPAGRLIVAPADDTVLLPFRRRTRRNLFG